MSAIFGLVRPDVMLLRPCHTGMMSIPRDDRPLDKPVAGGADEKRPWHQPNVVEIEVGRTENGFPDRGGDAATYAS